jgi:DNA-binding CsgD family transcriptional regulator
MLPTERVRGLFRLVHEAYEIGPTTSTCRDHLVAGITRLIGAPLGAHLLDPDFRPEGNTPLVRMNAPQYESRFAAMIAVPTAERRGLHPMLAKLSLRTQGAPAGLCYTFSRRDLVEDGSWYHAPYVMDVLRTGGCDDWLVSTRTTQVQHLVTALALVRAHTDRPFSKEDSELLDLFHQECSRLFLPKGGELDELKRRRLSPRLEQTLDLLLTGAADKEIAERIGISHHTVHQYVKSLFRIFDVSSRAQLISRVLKPTRRRTPEVAE